MCLTVRLMASSGSWRGMGTARRGKAGLWEYILGPVPSRRALALVSHLLTFTEIAPCGRARRGRRVVQQTVSGFFLRVVGTPGRIAERSGDTRCQLLAVKLKQYSVSHSLSLGNVNGSRGRGQMSRILKQYQETLGHLLCARY